MNIIDFHTHAFPDRLAARAVPSLAQAANVPAILDGTLTGLLASMDGAGIASSVVVNIATKPEQFPDILAWCLEIASPRIAPFVSVHPRDPDAMAQVSLAAARGIRGVKLHSYYQDFDLDDPNLFGLYRTLEEARMVLLIHAGFDIAYPRVRRCDPVRVRRVVDRFPELRLVAAHLGGWQDWDDVERYLLGQPIYLDTSYCFADLGLERARALVLAHPKEYVLFGSDSPWKSQSETLGQLAQLGLDPEAQALVLGGNAARLLNLMG